MTSSSLYRFCSSIKDDLKRQRFEEVLTLTFIALVPLKLTPAYIALIPALTSRIFSRRLFPLSDRVSKTFYPLIFFFVSAALCSLFGIDATKSLGGILGFVGAALVIPLIAQMDQRKVYRALFLGVAIVGVDSMRTQLFPLGPRIFLGEVTESGQLALVTVLVVGAMMGLAFKLRRQGKTLTNLGAPVGVGAVLLASFLTIGFTHIIPPALGFLVVLVELSLVVFYATWQRRTEREYVLCCSLLLPLVAANLVFNLKRGPFVGVCVALGILFFFQARKLLLPFVTTSIIAAVTLEPLRARFAHSLDHFFISGGRSVMWRIGGELISRYPLGIGFKNSGFLRSFSSEIPPELRHFHNNALNIVVESGWISLCLFFYWVISLLKLAFTTTVRKRHYTPLLQAAGCAIISWQIAGLVEYNVGDKEVMLLVFLVAGLIGGADREAA